MATENPIAEAPRSATTSGGDSARSIHEVLQSIVEGTSSATSGPDFFRLLTRSLAQSLGVRYTFIGEVIDGGARVRTLAIWADGEPADDVEYDLAGTPCDGVVGKAPCFYPQDVQAQFPKDTLLVDMQVESYVGTPLVNQAGEALGLLVAMDDTRMSDGDLASTILSIFAGRASAELERMRAEEERTERETRLRLATEQIPAVLWTTDTDLIFTSSRGAGLKTLGLETDQVVGVSLSEYFNSDDSDCPPLAAHRRALTGESATYDFEWQGRSFHTYVEPLRGVDGAVTGCIGIALDTTECKDAERELRRLEQEKRLILDSATELIVYQDLNQRVVWVNRAAAASVGARPEDLVGRHCYDIWHQRTEACDDCPVTKAMQTGQPQNGNITTPDGRTWQISGSPVLDENGQVVGAVELALDTTDRHRAEEALHLTQFTVDRTADAVFWLESDGRFAYVNDEACRSVGYTRRELLGMKLWDVAPRVRPENWSALWKETRERGSVTRETCHRSKHGDIFPVEVTANYVNFNGRELICSFARDISERRRTEQTLRESEERFRQLAENIREVFWLTDWADRKVAYISPAYETVYGQSRQSLHDEPGSWAKNIHPDDKPRVLAAYDKSAELGSYDEEFRLLHPDGSMRWIHDRAFPIRDETGRVYRVAGFSEDVTARKMGEEATRISEELYRTLFSQSPDAVLLIDPETTLPLEFNDQMLSLLGYSREEFAVLPISAYEAAENPEEIDAHIVRVLETGRDEFETKWRTKGGDIRDVRIKIQVIELAGRRIFHNIIRDITDAKRAEAALRAKENLLRETLEATADGILVVDENGKTVHANARFASMWRIPSALLKTHDDEKLLEFALSQLKDPNAFLDKVQSLYASTDVSLDTLSFKDGRIFERYSRPLMQDGVVAGRVWSFRDITGLMRQQAELAQAKRLETAGQLAGQVAHDFNNLLGPLAAYPELARRHLEPDSPVHRMLDIIENCATQMAEINQELLTLGRRGHYKVEPLLLNPLIESTLAGCDIPETVNLRFELMKDLLPIKGGRAQLQRVLVNLISNAVEGLYGVGDVTIATDNFNLDKPLGRYSLINRGEYVRVRISDTGAGIPQEIMDRIFDPFFTTKKTDQQRGSGLGLSVVHSVIEDHEGYVDIESIPGCGTTVSFYLPVHRGEVDAPEVSGETPRGHGERVLVVDDDPIQRQVVGDALRSLGYEVSTVSSGEEAVAFVAEHPQDVLLLDMVMDGIDGVETLRRIRETYPAQTALMLSGFATNERVALAMKLGAREFLSKPVRLPALGAALARALQEVPAATAPDCVADA